LNAFPTHEFRPIDGDCDHALGVDRLDRDAKHPLAVALDHAHVTG
jgi:hypothetical protein